MLHHTAFKGNPRFPRPLNLFVKFAQAFEQLVTALRLCFDFPPQREHEVSLAVGFASPEKHFPQRDDCQQPAASQTQTGFQG